MKFISPGIKSLISWIIMKAKFFDFTIKDVGKVDYSRRSSKNQSLCNFTCGVSTNPMPAIEEIYSRRMRCGNCQACNISEDCNGCQNCAARQKLIEARDPNARRKICVMRDCLRPQLAPSEVCEECGKDGWNDAPNPFQIMGKPKHGPSNLMECIMCLKIVHPLCISSEVCARSVAIVNEDLPNSWECPMCVDKSKPVRGVKRMRSHEERRNHYQGRGDIGDRDRDNVVSSSTPSSTREYPEINNGMFGSEVNNSPSVNGSVSSSLVLNGKPGYQSGLLHDIKPDVSEGTAMIKQEIGESNGVQKKASLQEYRSVRDDEDLVRQKIDQVVRRKSTEDSMKAAAHKVSSSIKRTMSATDVTKNKQARRLSEDIPRNGDADSSSKGGMPSPKVSIKEPDSSTDCGGGMLVPPAKKIKTEEMENGEEDEDNDKDQSSSDDDEETEKKKVSPIKYPFRSLSLDISDN